MSRSFMNSGDGHIRQKESSVSLGWGHEKLIVPGVMVRNGVGKKESHRA